MDEKTRLNLQKLVTAFDADDNTEKIRNLRHSQRIKDDVDKLISLKSQYGSLCLMDKSAFEKLVHSHCTFLWRNYTNIFNRLLKDELDVSILDAFLSKLRDIEEGRLDQHTASADVGTILKRLYIDSAMKRQNKLEQEAEAAPSTNRKPARDISWSLYKKSGLFE